MKIPLLWLKDYLDIDKTAKEIADSFTRIGLMLDKPVGEDNVLDLEQRLNRSDLLSILGCARDLSVFENLKLREPKVRSNKTHAATSESKVEIVVDTPAVNRFTTRVFFGIKVGESPAWLKDRLNQYGIASINNIVDITNFVMVELGQPMHAQDIAKLNEKKIHIRQAKDGETITTLLGTKISLDKSAFVLASGGIPQVIGGVVGGSSSGVTSSTTNIVLDAGNYDPRVIRTVSRKLKIVNETVTHYDKPLDPRLTGIAIARATDLILELAGGKCYDNVDYYPNPVVPKSLSITYDRLKLISGLTIPVKKVKTILLALGYIITEDGKSGLTVEVPYYRTDIEVEDDLISDILRMSDYNTIPLSSLTTSIPPDITPPIYRFEEKLRDYMLALGAHEHITTQLVEDDQNSNRIVLENALSEDQNALRLSALETLPSVVVSYEKHKLSPTIIFEIGKSFNKNVKEEIRELAIIDKVDVRKTLSTLMTSLGLRDYILRDNNGQIEISYKSELLGLVYEYSCVLYTNILMSYAKEYPPIISEFGHSTSLDISIELPTGMKFETVISTCRKVSPSLYHLEVVEEYNTWKLTRLTWKEDVQSLDELRVKIVSSLKELGIKTRSEN